MEDVRGWNAGRRPQTSRADTIHIQSTAWPSSSSQSQSPRSPLRPSRSVTNLRSPTIDHPPLPPLPVETYNQDLDLLPPPPPYEVRRVRSSSALSVGASPSITTPTEQEASSSKWKTFCEEAQFKASGLIGKAVESNKHYSVIRHSSWLVWYQGPQTSVTFTILSDRPLPPNRTVWLQKKGHSGNMGMALKAMVNSGDGLVDVTPAQEAQVQQIPATKERNIRRDIDNFIAKAAKGKKHIPRETHMVRIPATATDGYYRLVVRGGRDDKNKSILCECTVFRIASSSVDPAVVRGASLKTLPLEMGISIGTTIARQVAKKYTGVAGAVVTNRAGKIVAKQSVKKATTVALKGYHGVGGPGLQGAVQESWRRQRAAGPVPVGEYTTEEVITVIGADEGPVSPFPKQFEGRIVRGAGRSATELGFPTASLADVPGDVKVNLAGVFAAWVMILPGKKNVPDGLSPDWHPAIVTIAPRRGAAPTVAMENEVSVHVLYDFGSVHFFECRLNVLLMGWLHAPAVLTASATDILYQHEMDITTTMASLDRENWQPDGTIERMRTLKSGRSFSERLDSATSKVIQRVDTIPLHLVGMRSESETLRDQSYGIGGLWIRRD